jgi:hypothetical protein
MNLYIETENEQSKNHPALENNLIEAFGAIPEHWEPFVRVERPILSVYQFFNSEDPIYQKVNGVWTDVWDIREMTAEEKSAKQQIVKDNWARMPNFNNFTTWVFDETICNYVPPVPRPNNNCRWDGATNSWIEIT